MLKKYIQALLEGFLASKRAWVSEQSFPTGNNISQTVIANGNWNYITSPISGYFCIKAKCTNIVLSNSELWQGTSTSGISYKGFYIPISKGESVGYILSTDAEGVYAHFIKSVGNSS